MLDQSFDGLHVGQFLGHKERQGIALLGGATGAPDAVNVVFRMLGNIVVDHMGDPGDIKSARGDVGGNEDRIFA